MVQERLVVLDFNGIQGQKKPPHLALSKSRHRLLDLLGRLVVSGVAIGALIASSPLRNTGELGPGGPMTVSSVAEDEIVTISLRLLVGGSEVFPS
jgi:hypothetical protein